MNLNLEFNDIPLNLEIFAEEAAECIKVKSKIIRFGLMNFSPSEGMINKEVLANEVGHFFAMVDILIDNGILSPEEIEKGKQEKFKKLPKYYGNYGRKM